MSQDVSLLNQLSCLKLSCQIRFICAPINKGKTEKTRAILSG